MAPIAEGELVAIEAKDYWNCYTRFTCHYDVICKQDTASENLEATGENELLQFIKEVAGCRRMLAVQDLRDMMTE